MARLGAVRVVHFVRMNDPRPEAESGAAEPRDTPMHSHVRCVTVLPPQRDEPAELREAMGRRGVAMTCYRSVYDALLAVLDVGDDAPVALVVVDPGAFAGEQAGRLVLACARRVERLSAWRFDAQAGEVARLRPFVVEVVTPHCEPEDELPDEPAEWEPSEMPRLRLAGFHDGDEPDDVHDDVTAELENDEGEKEAPVQSPESVSEMLTSEEIAMLLDDLPFGESKA